MANRATRRNKKRKGLPAGAVVGLAATGAAILGVYLGMAFYYRSHYFPNTTVGGITCGGKDADYVESRNVRYADDYLLSVVDRKGNKFHIAGQDIGYSYVANKEEEAILSRQNAFAWPSEVFRTHTVDLDRSFVYKEKKLLKQIASLEIFDESYIEAPVNAHLELKEDGYEIVEEIPGNAPVAEQVAAEITAAVDGQETSVTLSDACYQQPKILSTDESIAGTAAKIDSFLASTIHYEIDGADENLTEKQIMKLLDITEDGTVTVNEARLTDLVQRMASTYNTYGDTRKFKTSNGDKIKIGGGDYGWVINKRAEAAQILEDLSGGVPVSREPVYEQRAWQSGLDDIGDTYVEIDYTNQHMWYYKDGELVLETDVVTGNVNRGNGSPDGVFKIVYCQRNATLVGEDYESSVKYFMPFAYNVGFHDASWRNTFGGEIYKRSGSHGCINMPEEYAKQLIDAIEIGTPVIAYYREPVKLTAENARISNAYSYVKPEED